MSCLVARKGFTYWIELKSLQVWKVKFSIALKVMTFLGGPPSFPDFFRLAAVAAMLAFLLRVSELVLAVWKQLMRWPTSGGLHTREDRNLWTSSFLHNVSLWYRALAVMAVREMKEYCNHHNLKFNYKSTYVIDLHMNLLGCLPFGNGFVK